MCAVVGMLNSASMIALCAIPPVRSASHSAASLATGMNVGFGLVGVLLGLQPHAAASASACGRSAIALSSVCITSRMIVRRDQPRGDSACAKRARMAQRSAPSSSAAA